MNGLISVSQIIFYAMRALCMLLIIPMHEAAHAWASYKLGDPTAKNAGRLTLNPVAHFDLLGAVCMVVAGVGWAKPVGINARNFQNPKQGMALTALAGPASNLLAAVLATCLYKVYGYHFYTGAGIQPYLLQLLSVYISLNITLAVFNMMPVPPFDGSRLATAFLPTRLYFRVMRYERYIFMAMFVLLVMGVFSTPLSYLYSWVWQGIDAITSFIR